MDLRATSGPPALRVSPACKAHRAIPVSRVRLGRPARRARSGLLETPDTQVTVDFKVLPEHLAQPDHKGLQDLLDSRASLGHRARQVGCCFDNYNSRCRFKVETHGSTQSSAIDFLNVLGDRTTTVTGDPRDKSFLLQRIFVLLQRCNFGL